VLYKEGYRVFLFDEGRREMEKFDFRVRPITLKREPFPQFLSEVRDGFVVAVAATPAAAAGLMSNPEGWARIGVPADHVFRRAGSSYGVIGVGGARSGALEPADASGGRDVDLSLPGGAPVGATRTQTPADIRVQANSQRAAIWINGEEIARTADGAVAALISPTGSVETFVLELADGFRVPIDMQPIRLYELTSAGTCVNLGNVGWSDISSVPISGRVMVRVDNYRPFLSRATFYVVGDRPASPTLTEASGTGVPALTTRSYRLGDAADAAELERQLAADKLAIPFAPGAGEYVSRLEMTVDDNGDFKSVVIDFGLSAAQTLANLIVDRDAPRRATVCGAPAGS